MVTTDGALAVLLDPSRDLADRLAAVERSEDAGLLASIEALTRVAQQVDVPPELATAVGRMLAQLCFERREDIHELDMAMVSDAAGEAYDREVARLLRQHPGAEMRRSGVGH